MHHLIGNDRNNVSVYVNLIQSDVAKQISRQPHLLALVREALSSTALKGPGMVIERDMKRSIGYSFVVATSEASTVFYAKLLRDEAYTRFVKGVQPISTQFLTLTLGQSADGSYMLNDFNIGKAIPARPGTEHEAANSKPYWAEHAYVYDKESIQTQTLTKVCPY